MSRSRRSFSTEFKDELCREVIDSSKPVSEVAKAYGVGDDSLRRWLTKYRETHGGGPESELTLTERARLTQLERENRELRAEAAFLKKAASYVGDRCQVPVSSSRWISPSKTFCRPIWPLSAASSR